MRLWVLTVGLPVVSCALQAQATTTTTLTSVTPAAPVFGQAVTLTAQVTPASAPATAISFMAGGVLLGVGTLNAGRIAQTTTLTLPAGLHSLRAVYGSLDGSGFAASQSTAMPYIVTAVPGAGFMPLVNYGAGFNPTVVADFNGDGKADLAGPGPGNTVSVALGNGNGTFHMPVNYAVGTNPAWVEAGDFNKDGKVDLAVANSGSANVSILLNNGDGTFAAASNIGLGSGSVPHCVAVADFNGDGETDVVVGDQDSVSGGGHVHVLLGKGDGTFQPSINTSTGVTGALAVHDFNGDGKVDLAVLHLGTGADDGSVGVWLGNGTGSFVGAGNVGGAGVGNPSSMAVVDLPGVGAFLVVTTGDGLNVLLSDSSNGKIFSNQHYSLGVVPFSVAVGDFNGDGKADLIVGDSSPANTVTVLLGNDTFYFQSAGNYNAGAGLNSMVVGDFNGDGRADVGVFTGVLLGTVPPATSVTLQSAPNPSTFGHTVTLTADVTPSNASGKVEFLDGTTVVGTGTLNLSGRAQIATTLLPSGTQPLHARYTGGSGSWQSSESGVANQVVNAVAGSGFTAAPNAGAGSGPQSVAEGDFNGDGKTDLVVANAGGNVNVLLGNGDGTFAMSETYPVGNFPTWVSVADFNGDGKADLAVAQYLGANVAVLLGNGDGSFQLVSNNEVGNNPDSIAVGDFNGDGKPDLAVANFGGGVSVLLGNGDGIFRPPLSYDAGPAPAAVAAGDLNGDGLVDLVVPNNSSATVSILLGIGNGTFQPPVSYGAGASPISVALGDFNRDGKVDLAVVNYAAANVSVLLGNGNGTFQTAVNYSAGTNPQAVTLGDFNGDGKIDLAVANATSNNVSILLGKGDGTFQGAVNYGVGTSPESLAVGDFNGDGRADLAVGNTSSNNVSMLLGAAVSTNGVVPNAGAGAVQTFAGTYSAANGYQDLQWVQMLFAVTTSGDFQFCYVHYDVPGNKFWLYSDTQGFFVGPVAPGTASNQLQGSLCALNTLGSSVSGNGLALTVNASLVFKQALVLNVYMRAYTFEGIDTGWVQQGTWTTAAASLGTMTVAPSSGSVTHGTQQTLTLTYPDTPGFAGAAFGWQQFLVAVASNGGGQPFCFVHYDRAGNGLWMYSSDVGFFLGPVTPGTASSALNSSACSVNPAGATVQNTGGNLVLTVPVTLKGPMVGSQKTFQRTLDVLNRDTGFVQTGTLTVN